MVFEADVSQGTRFFSIKLAEAIKKKPFKKSPTNERTLASLETLFQVNDGFRLSFIQKHRACRLVHDYLNDQGLIPDTLSDYDYFRKFLKRHGFS